MRQYMFNIFLWDTQNGVMKKKNHWFDYFEKIHLQYNIMPAESSNYYVSEDSRFISFMTYFQFSLIKNRNRILFKRNLPMFFLDDLYWTLTLEIE